MTTTGKIKRIIGPVVDVEFADHVPEIYSALTVMNGAKKLTLETENSVTLSLNYDFELKEDFYGHYGYANIRCKF